MQTKPIIVQLVHEPPKEVTVGDVLLGAFGLTGALILFSLVLAGLFAIVLVRRNRRRPPELDHPPSISGAFVALSPGSPGHSESAARPSSPAR